MAKPLVLIKANATNWRRDKTMRSMIGGKAEDWGALFGGIIGAIICIVGSWLEIPPLISGGFLSMGPLAFLGKFLAKRYIIRKSINSYKAKSK